MVHRCGLQSIFSIVFFVIVWCGFAEAQDKIPYGNLLSNDANLLSIEPRGYSASPALWHQYNRQQYAEHPEFGLQAINGPSGDYVEILSKRTARERYFVNALDSAEFIQQTSYSNLHYKVGSTWVSIDPSLSQLGIGIYEASQQPEPVGIDMDKKMSYIRTKDAVVGFNHWKLYGKKENKKRLIGDADWSSYTVGSDGAYISNVFPGIDLRIRVFQSTIKSDFIIRELLFEDFDFLLFEDEYTARDEQIEFRRNDEGTMELFNTVGYSILTIGEAVIYPAGQDKEEMMLLDYSIQQNSLGVTVPFHWLKSKLENGHVILDPLVTSSNFLAQSSIIGSQYNPSCDFIQSCDYTLTVNTPANATITNITTSFDYLASGSCWLEDGAMRFSVGSCLSPSQAGYYWFCNTWGGGTCIGNNTPLWPDVGSCAPSPSCAPVPMQFTLKLYRSCYGNSGCSSGCISAGSNWSISISGRTIEYSSTNPTLQMGLSATTVCQGGQIIANAIGIQNGVPPYNINWSLNSTGSPSVGTGTSTPIVFSTTGTNTIYCSVTDACGNTISTSRSVTVTAPPAGPSVNSPVHYCLNETAVPLTSQGNSPLWYAAQFGGNPIVTPTPTTSSVGTTSYWQSHTVGGCESLRSEVLVEVHALPVITGTPLITPSACNGSTGGISGLSTSAPPPITYTWKDANGTTLSTSTSSSDLVNQPSGDYTLFISDLYNCEGSQSGYTIPNENGPNGPIVSSPVSYCQGDVPVALTAQGTQLLWYTQPSLGVGVSTAPTPDSSTPGSTFYYVSQTTNGCESIRSEIEVVVIATPAAPNVTTPFTYCKNDTPEVLQAVGSNLLWYSTSSGGTGASVTPSVNTAIVGSTNYYVSQTVQGCESPRASVSVEIYALPSITGTPTITPSACNGNTGTISGLSVSGGLAPYTYNWVDNIGDTIGHTVNLSNLAVEGYVLHVIDQNLCSTSSGVIQVPISTPPIPPQTSSTVEYCQGYTTVPLTAVGSGLLWYTSSTGGVGTSTAPTPNSQNVGNTSYWVSQTVNGCESIRREVVVNIVDSPGADFTITTQTGCAPFCVTFQNLSTPTSTPIVSYVWSANTTVFSTDKDPHRCFDAGTYQISLLVTDATGCTRNISKSEFLRVAPKPTASFSASRDEASESDPTIEFSSENPRPEQTVSWSFGDGTTASGNTVTHSFPEAGRYCVTQTVTGTFQCSDRTERCILITSDFFLYVPNSFTPSGDGINDVWKPVIRGKYNTYRLSIFNRYGERIFFSNDSDEAWMGNVNNGEHYAMDGIYHFIIVIEDEDNIPKEYRGHIQMVR